jgi:hypothetical protein
MSFNSETVAADMLSAMKKVLSNYWPKAKSIAEQIMANRKKRMKLLEELYLKGEITTSEFKSRLEDETTICEAEIEALKVVVKALAQKALNAAIAVLINAIAKII